MRDYLEIFDKSSTRGGTSWKVRGFKDQADLDAYRNEMREEGRGYDPIFMQFYKQLVLLVEMRNSCD